ncbi:MAG: nucleotide exchange factor GrpE [Flavobacteriales bacterium]|nr:nucleotide exchange factor GrpE [Flavobacteriales bacterium]
MSKEEHVHEEASENVSASEESTVESNTEETEALHDELNDAEAKYKEINDKYLRLYSDFENFRKRTQKEKVDLYKTAGEDVISAILPVLDDFERAFKAMEDATELQALKDGVKLIHDKLANILKQKGLEEIESAVNKDFDIEHHEAITQIPAPSKKEVGKVMDEVEKGYKLNGKVIRYTKVVVGK